MFVIFYTKSSNEIIAFKHDMSTPSKTEVELADQFFKDTKLDNELVGHASLSGNPFTEFDTNKYIYSPATGTVSENAAYVAPVSQEIQVQPPSTP